MDWRPYSFGKMRNVTTGNVSPVPQILKINVFQWFLTHFVSRMPSYKIILPRHWNANNERLPVGTCITHRNLETHLWTTPKLSPLTDWRILATHFKTTMMTIYTLTYSGPSILRLPMGRRKCTHILQVLLKYRSSNTQNGTSGPKHPGGSST